MDISCNKYHNFYTYLVVKFHKTTYDFVQFTSNEIQALHPNTSTLRACQVWYMVGMNLM